MQGILGRKAGMTTIFAQDGRAIPVTVVEVKPNTVLQVKTVAVDGYSAIKLGVEDKKDHRATRAELGEAKKANTSAKYFMKEIRNMEGFELGQTISADLFEAGDFVDVTGTSKGKGFQGNIKRHNQHRGPMSHGSKSHRITGSIGDIAGHVIKGKKMPGHMGHVQVTMQNLEVVAVDLENNVLLIKGSIPGPNKSFVVIKEAVKIENKAEAIELLNVAEATAAAKAAAEAAAAELAAKKAEADAKKAEEKAAKEAAAAEKKAAADAAKAEKAAEEAKVEEAAEEAPVAEEAAPAVEEVVVEEAAVEATEEVVEEATEEKAEEVKEGEEA